MNLKNLEQKLFERYDIEYNIKHKILYIHKPIQVSDMQIVRALVKDYDVDDIIVEPRSYLRI